MELTASEDIEAPQDKVFAALSDFDTVERLAMRRGVEIARTTDRQPPSSGMEWRASFRFRGKPRQAAITLTAFEAPDQMVFKSVSGGLEVLFTMDVVALSPSRSRINITTVLSPKTLSARLLVQSLKLAKGGMDKRFRKRIADLANGVEARARGMA